uniref:SGNH hydrolase-type esterase domain-containing protein n=1 Tax=Alexandrium catenella TaxID=2925 RepID=A0A7S1SFY0_ALECA
MAQGTYPHPVPSLHLMPHLRLVSLYSALQLCHIVRARASLADAAALIQQDLFKPGPQATLTAAGSCSRSPLPAPLHYNYGKYKGVYAPTTVEWGEDEFRQAGEIVRSSSTYEQLVPLMQKLQRGETLKMVVFGGSSTAGSNCKQGPRMNPIYAKECAWPRRFQHWLQEAFPQGKVELVNFAQGAATSSSILAGAGLMLQSYDSHRADHDKGADIIFVDALVNDVYQIQNDWGHDGSANRRLVDLSTNSALAYEQLLRTLHTLQPEAVIFPVIAGCDLCRRHREIHRKVIDFYNLPKLDWGDVVAWKPHLWDGPDVHPFYWYHASLADVMAQLWGSVWQDTCSAGYSRLDWHRTYNDPAELKTFQPCLHPLSAYDAAVPSSTKNVEMTGGWALYEDRPGKPGWISETPGSRMAMNVKFGKHPVLVISWMRSYEKMGYANMYLNGKNYQLDGQWTEGLKENVTLAYTRWLQVDRPSIQVGPYEVGVAGFNIGPDSNMTMVFEVPLDHTVKYKKMKILQVFTC